jgi:hypothetical protein
MAGSAERQVARFIAKYSPQVARVARQARGKIRKLLPGAVELVYDNYNALALAFGPTERASEPLLHARSRAGRLPGPASWIR